MEASGGTGEDICRPAAIASVSTGIKSFAAAALEDTADAIEHIVGGASTSTSVYRPSVPKKSAPTVKQMDIRAWFGTA